MGFADWTRTWFNGTSTVYLDDCHFQVVAEAHFQKLAFETAVTLIANAIVRCEFQTFTEGKRIRGENHYLLNIQPNVNQNATQFMHDVVRSYLEGDCLIVMVNNQYYVADEFEVLSSVTKENRYKDVKIGDFKFDKVFYEREVIRLKMADKKAIDLINRVYATYGKLLASSMDFYRRKNNKRLLIKGNFMRAQDDATQKKINELFERQMKDWFDPEKGGSAFQLQEGLNIEDMSDSAKGGSMDSRDIQNLVEDVFNTTAAAFHIPRGILKGDLADIEKQTDNFIMFCVNPIVELFADEFNRKIYTKEEYLKRTYLKIDTSKIKVTDITTLSNAIDKLFRVGGVTINDIQEMLGEEPINEPYAEQRFVTKNYAAVEVLASGTTLEGGDNDDNETIQEREIQQFKRDRPYIYGGSRK